MDGQGDTAPAGSLLPSTSLGAFVGGAPLPHQENLVQGMWVISRLEGGPLETQVFIPRLITLATFHNKVASSLLKNNYISSCIAWTHHKGGKILHFQSKESTTVVMARLPFSLRIRPMLHHFSLLLWPQRRAMRSRSLGSPSCSWRGPCRAMFLLTAGVKILNVEIFTSAMGQQINKGRVTFSSCPSFFCFL